MSRTKKLSSNLLNKFSFVQNSNAKLALFSSVLVLFLFFIIAFFSPFKDKLLSLLFPKPSSYAATLLFGDEFDGSTLKSVWTNGVFWWNTGVGGEGVGEQAGYQPSQATVANGYLNLTAINQPTGARPFTSGMVQTGGIKGKTATGFSYLYGYAEARIKLPPGNGMWPAFWSWPADYSDSLEIDILENLGKQINTYYATLHTPNYASQIQYTHTGPDLSADFHNYAVDWQPDYIDYYFDGVKIGHYDDTAHYFSKPMYLILNLALGGTWAGPVDITKLPAIMAVDWVHVYQSNPNVIPSITSTPTPSLVQPPTSTILPTATLTPVPVSTGMNLLKNGSFEGGVATWFLNTTSPASGSLLSAANIAVDGNSSATININSIAPRSWYVQFRQDNLSLVAGKTYTVTFWAKANKRLKIDYTLQQMSSPYTAYFNKSINLLTKWQKYSYTYTAAASVSNIFLGFNLANTKASIWIDNVSLVSN